MSLVLHNIKCKPSLKLFDWVGNIIRMASSDVPSAAQVKRSNEDETAEEKAKKRKPWVPAEESKDGKFAEALAFKQAAKAPRKKVAMLLSYSGVGYKGMQINPGTQTIEKELFDALVKAGAIPEEHARQCGKMMFQRCARTDKGVSALGQVVSLKMYLIENVVEKINEHLPKVIRVMDFKRTTGSFDAKNHCDCRTYSYLLPSYAFQDLEEVTTDKYRITDEKLKEVNDLLSVYLGTKNFHNFTAGKLHNDASAKRYIMNISCKKAFEDDGLELLEIKVKGQSFMLHQIRKMIGLVIAIIRGITPRSTMDKAFEDKKIDMSRAPGLGLMLEMVHFEAYNKKWGNDGIHERLLWEDSQEKLEEFKLKHIYPNIIVREKYNKSMMRWLSTLHMHTFDVITGHNPMKQFIIEAKKDLKKRESEEEDFEETIPADMDLSEWKPGQTPTEFLKTQEHSLEKSKDQENQEVIKEKQEVEETEHLNQDPKEESKDTVENVTKEQETKDVQT